MNQSTVIAAMTSKVRDPHALLTELRHSSSKGDRAGLASLLLLNASMPSFYAAAAIHAAAAKGHAECVKILVPLAGPSCEKNSLALLAAAHNGHLECINVLIDSQWAAGPPSAFGYDNLMSGCLCEAARNGHAECVSLFMPLVSELRHGEKVALYDAIDHGVAMASHDLSLRYVAQARLDPSNKNHRHISQFLHSIEESRSLSEIAIADHSSPQHPTKTPRL